MSVHAIVAAPSPERYRLATWVHQSTNVPSVAHEAPWWWQACWGCGAVAGDAPIDARARTDAVLSRLCVDCSPLFGAGRSGIDELDGDISAITDIWDLCCILGDVGARA